MNATLVTFGPWQIPVAVKHCLCPDGTRRRARITGYADTYFSIPASVTVKGVTVSGFITGRDNEGQQDYEFIPYTYRKNHAVFTARCTCHGINFHDATCPAFSQAEQDSWAS